MVEQEQSVSEEKNVESPRRQWAFYLGTDNLYKYAPAGLGFVLGVSAGLAIGGWLEEKEKEYVVQPTVGDSLVDPNRLNFADLINGYPENWPQEDRVGAAILFHKAAVASFSTLSEYEIKNGLSDVDRYYIETQRRNLVLDGVSLIKYLDTADILKIQQTGTRISVLGNDFDITKTRDIMILNELFDQSITVLTVGEDNQVREARQRIDSLLWFFNSGINLEIDPFVFGFPGESVLLKFAQIYRTLGDLGYEYPDKIRFKVYEQGDSSGWFSPFLNEIILTDRAGANAIVHEEAHHQAEVNSRFSQEEFDRIVSEALKDGVNIQDTYADFNALHGDLEQEDYAITTEIFFNEGLKFRELLKKLYETQNPAVVVLRAKYEFAKAFFGGKEYTKDGILLEPMVGDAFKIADPMLDNKGIKLRPMSFEDGNYQVIVSGEEVKIIDGPRTAFYSFTGREETIWKVALAYLTSDGYAVEDDYSGWIWQGWLGEKLDSEVNDDSR